MRGFQVAHEVSCTGGHLVQGIIWDLHRAALSARASLVHRLQHVRRAAKSHFRHDASPQRHAPVTSRVHENHVVDGTRHVEGLPLTEVVDLICKTQEKNFIIITVRIIITITVNKGLLCGTILG